MRTPQWGWWNVLLAFGGSDETAHDRMPVVMAQARDAAPGRVVGALQDPGTARQDPAARRQPDRARRRVLAPLQRASGRALFRQSLRRLRERSTTPTAACASFRDFGAGYGQSGSRPSTDPHQVASRPRCANT